MDQHEPISYKTLRKLQQAEQTSSVLTRISLNFYQELSSYIKILERSSENEKNPLKVKLFHDEIQNTRKIANSIYELREKKIVQGALATARGASLDLSNFLEVEKKLYYSLVDQIKLTRAGLFEQPENQTQTNQPTTPVMSQVTRDSNTHPIVRVIEDTPEFIGTDGKTYLLQKEDVLTLPEDMNEPLLKKKVVKQIK